MTKQAALTAGHDDYKAESYDDGERAPNLLYQPAFHGSAYEFDRFSLNHLGNGEGAQSFGWGLYFTSTREVAEHYRETVSSDTLLVGDGSLFNPSALEHLNVKVTLQETANLESAIARAKGLIMNGHGAVYAKNDLKVLEQLQARGGIRKNPGQLYEVDIPDDGDFLLWDKPLADQPERVQELLSLAYDKVRMGGDDSHAGEVLLEVLDDVHEDKTLVGGDIYEKLAYGLGGFIRNTYNIEEDPRAASEFLNSIGIAGIKYLDGMSRGSKEGTFNYVIFDDAAIEILSRNDTPLQRHLNQIAYHGSPHHFERFSLEHIGQGEGAQAYGWGLYFTESLALARSYTGDEGIGGAGVPALFEINGHPVERGSAEHKAADLVSSMGLPAARRLAREMLEEAEAGVEWTQDRGLAYYQKIMQVLKELKRGSQVSKRKGRIYNVDIPDADEMLDWYSSLPDQPAKVRAVLDQLFATSDAAVNRIHPTEDDGAWAYTVMSTNLGSNEAASRFLLAHGIKGVRYRNRGENNGYNFVVFDDSSVQIRPDVHQANSGGDPRGTFTYGYDIKHSESVISLLKDADLSTFVHESGHFYLEVLSDMAALPEPPQSAVDDMGVVLAWFGVDKADWCNFNPSEKESYHEQFARGFEAFVLEGKVTAPKLKGVFGRASDWMKRLYCSMRNLNVSLNDDIRAVFDRLLASETPRLALARQKELHDIAKSFEEQLRVLDRQAEGASQVYARMVSAFYDVQSARLGISPREMLDRYQLRVRVEAPHPKAAAQKFA